MCNVKIGSGKMSVCISLGFLAKGPIGEHMCFFVQAGGP